MSALLRARILAAPGAAGAAGDDLCVLATPDGDLSRADIARLRAAPGLGADDRVLVCIADTRALVRVLAALDGTVGGLLLVSSAVAGDAVAALADAASCGVIVSDRDDLSGAHPPDAVLAAGGARDGDAQDGDHASPVVTDWMMTTSGTTGLPKIVPHTLDSLARTVRRDPLGRTLVSGPVWGPVWGLVLDMTRFAGLQVALQAVLGGGTLAAADRHTAIADQIAWLAARGVTHLSATPTLWRRLLMAPGLERLTLRQVTLGGEIADQGVLDALAARFPDARITHIYASTEAGVGFAVNDRRAGFPLAFLDHPPGGVGVAVRDGLLWLRPPDGRRVRYLGGQTIETDDAGFVLTGDRIDLTPDRALFLGRDSGVVNVGGVKVWPERVERIIAAVPGVGLAQVTAKSSPITGALLVATVVPVAAGTDTDALRAAILAQCRATLEREAVPARIRFADTLPMNAAGKITRT